MKIEVILWQLSQDKKIKKFKKTIDKIKVK